MILILFAVLLTLGVLAALLVPLMRPHTPPAPAERFNAAVYRQQLDELEADVSREVLPGAEAAGARVEIERRLLTATRRSGAEDEAPRRAPLWAAVVVALVMATAGVSLYLVLGRPNLPDQPFTGDRSLANARPASSAQASAQAAGPGAPGQAASPDTDKAQFEQLIAQLEQRMVANPGDEKGWLLLARGLMRLDRPSEAAAAYAHAIQLDGGKTLAIVSEAAEARVLAAGGKVDAEAIAQFRRVAAEDPKAPQPRFYLAMAKAQAGDKAGAVADWKALAADSPADAPYLPVLKARIAEAEGPAPP